MGKLGKDKILKSRPVSKTMNDSKCSLPKSKTQPGIILKQYESVLTQILSSSVTTVVPSYFRLPPLATPTPICREIKDDAQTMESDARMNMRTINEALQLTCASNPLPAQSYKLRGARPLPLDRALAKRTQLRSMIQCMAPMLPDVATQRKKKFRLLDFGGGTGHLALPLAILFPNCEIILVDLKKASLDMAHERAKAIISSLPSYVEKYHNKRDVEHSSTTLYDPIILKTVQNIISNHEKLDSEQISNNSISSSPSIQQTNIPNLFTFHGSISAYNESFDIGLALHACGEATDLALRKCGEYKANFVSCPCCIGKLSRKVKNPYIYQATNGNTPTVRYPQSNHFQSVMAQDDWDILAKAADYGEGHNVITKKEEQNQIKNGCNFRKVAKSLVEMDRLLYMERKYGYQVALTRMESGVKTPKNDILLGWIKNHDMNKQTAVRNPYHDRDSDMSNLKIDNEDFHFAMKYLGDTTSIIDSTGNKELLETRNGTNQSTKSQSCMDSEQNVMRAGSEWTKEEYSNIKSTIKQFLENEEERILKFPCGQTSRIRKLVHNIAATMDLRHWSEGKKRAERCVIVAKKKSDTLQQTN